VRLASAADLDRLDFAKGGGTVPLVAQHAHTGEVLMLGHADREALARSLADRELWFLSRSKGRLWRKGETSGHVLRVVALHADCDLDAVLARVEPAGPTCHTGARSCFGAPPTLQALSGVIAERAAGPPGDSYTQRLLADPNLRLKKLGEEAVELAMACGTGDPEKVAGEAADLVYHVLVACTPVGVDSAAVLAALERRLPPPRGREQPRRPPPPEVAGV
jgi:phosphoribosyl-ATP pyrophosphohydrolase/phosphoribosyl-AMP cyclohydrolase